MQPTRYGGLRRTGVTQRKSSGVTRRKSVYRNHPPVLEWAKPLGLEDCPYLIRWKLELPWFSLRLHHWISNDDPRALHDHPWNFYTIVIKGGYTDKSNGKNQYLKAPTIQYRTAEHQHTVFPDKGGAWTIVLTGPKIRSWGFWIAGRFKKANKYFLSHGHHPCS